MGSASAEVDSVDKGFTTDPIIPEPHEADPHADNPDDGVFKFNLHKVEAADDPYATNPDGGVFEASLREFEPANEPHEADPHEVDWHAEGFESSEQRENAKSKEK